jgi:D-3-phosphoglycerate dehydrogenase
MFVELQGALMTVQVLQVDTNSRLAPYAYERQTLRELGAEFVVGNCATEDEVIARGQSAEILFVSGEGLATGKVMAALPACRLIVRWGVGYDNIDVVAATAHGIAVANAPTYCGDEVAEHAIALLLAISRRVVWAHERMRSGAWPAADGPIHRLAGRTLGIIGCGRIGAKVAARARGLGFRVIAYDRYRAADDLRAIGVEPRTFDEVLAEADYLTLHVPLTNETRQLIDAAALAKLKPEAMIVNTSRGAVIDQAALIEALASGRLAGAALDVFDGEPLDAASPLRTMEHVVLTPHTAAYSIESIEALRVEMCETVGQWLADDWSERVVNPEVRERLRARR